jgi:hypothetical protein
MDSLSGRRLRTNNDARPELDPGARLGEIGSRAPVCHRNRNCNPILFRATRTNFPLSSSPSTRPR